VSISQGRGMPPWTPSNYSSGSFRGPTPLRVALEKSLNTVTARLAAALGMDAIGQTVEKFGIMERMPRFYAMALGAGETTPLRHTAAYAMLANGGKRIAPTLIDRIQDRYGRTVFRADLRECQACGETEWKDQGVPAIPDNREPVADAGSVFQLTTMLEGVVTRGTGTAVKAVGKPVAGKTGTTNDWLDAWFVGYTPDLAAGVFVGYDDPVYLGSDETGGHLAAPIFRDFMIAALKDAPAKEFRTPPGLRLYRVSPTTGLPAGAGEPAIWEGYKPGTEPGVDPMPVLPPSGVAVAGAPGDAIAIAPVAASPAVSGAPGAPTVAAPIVEAPAGGTGGLY
jgi:penicillin-binding protein 1A